MVVQAQTDTRPLSEGVDLAFGTKRDDIATPPAEIVANSFRQLADAAGRYSELKSKQLVQKSEQARPVTIGRR